MKKTIYIACDHDLTKFEGGIDRAEVRSGAAPPKHVAVHYGYKFVNTLEIDVPEKTITITESEFRKAWERGAMNQRNQASSQDCVAEFQNIFKLLFGDKT